MGLSGSGIIEGGHQGGGTVGVNEGKAESVRAGGGHSGKRKESLFLQHRTLWLPIYLMLPDHSLLWNSEYPGHMNGLNQIPY